MLDRFQDFENVSDFSFVIDPFTAKLEDVQYEEELIDMQASVNLQRYFEKNGYVQLWIAERLKVAPHLSKVDLEEAIIPFSLTYLAETTFKTVIHIKSKFRNRPVIQQRPKVGSH